MKSGLDGKRGLRPVFEAKPGPALHGSGARFRGNKTGIRWGIGNFSQKPKSFKSETHAL
jgi:hypothetical protein